MNRKFIFSLIAGIICAMCIGSSMVMLTGCHKDACDGGAPMPTAEVKMTTVDKYYADALVVLDAFVNKEIDSVEAIDKLADINREIWDLSYEDGKTPHPEQDGLDILSGEIEDFRSYIADYSVEQATMGVIKDRLKDFKKTNFNDFNK